MRRGALKLVGWLFLAFAPLLLGSRADARPQRSAKPDPRPATRRPAVKTVRPSKSAPGKSAPGKSRHGKSRRHGAREVPPQMPTRIELTAVDLVTGTAHVEVIGTSRPPATRLFILTDQSGRRFVPSFAECVPPPGVTLPSAPPGAAHPTADDDEPEQEATGPELSTATRWRCNLTIPRLYRQAQLASMSMEWGSRYVAAPAETVQRLWGEARAAAPLSAIANRQNPAPQLDPAAPHKPLPSMPETEDPPLDDDPSGPAENPSTAQSQREPPPAE